MVRFGAWAAALGLSLIWSGAALAQQTQTRSSSFAYDPVTGLLTQEVVQPDLPQFRLQTDYVHDAYGNRVSATVSGADITTRGSTTTYDARGQFAVSQANALSQSESWVHDPRFGEPVSHTGPNALSTTWEHDGFGRKTAEIRADGTRTTWSYRYCTGTAGGTDTCPAGSAYLVETNVLGADGVTPIAPTSIAYHDQLGRPIAADTEGFDGSPIRTVTEYDALGRVARKSRPFFISGGTPIYQAIEYDLLARPVLETLPDNTTLATTYSGLITTTTNALGQTRVTINNSQDQIVSVTDAENRTATYAYDPFGNLIEAHDPVGNVATFSYDKRGRKIAENDPDRGSWSYSYNVLDQLVSQTDAKGQTTTVSYDLLGRVIERIEPSLTSNWTYDTAAKGIGKLATATTNSGYARAHSYDVLGRPDGTTLTIDTIAYQFTTSYDSEGRVSQMSYPSGLTVGYSYNALGYQTQLTNLITSEVYWTANARDAELRLIEQTAGNGVATNHFFDPLMGRITAIQSGTGATVQKFDYSYDAVGNVTSRADSNNGWTETFTYDNLNRLKTANIGIDIAKSFDYDAVGNILHKSDVGNYAYPAPGQPFPHAVSSISGSVINTTFTYDANGNMLSGNGLAITYTAFNKPATIQRGSNLISFDHDTERGRFRQISSVGETLYLNSGGAMAERLAGSGGTTQWTDYLFAGGDMIGMRVEHSVSGVYTRYFHKDHLGSISTITDETGTVVERLSYDAWGKRRNIDGTDDPAGVITSQTTRGFTGHEQLAEVGLVHMNGRVYDPLIGRFGSADPMTEAPYSTQGWNRYAYVGNSPLNFNDPTGFCFMGCFWQKPFKALGKLLRSTPIIGQILTIAAAAACSPVGLSAVCGTLASAAVSGLASGDIGQALRAGLIAAATAAAFNVVGNLTGGLPGATPLEGGGYKLDFLSEAHVFNIAAHAAVGCGSAAASGGKCGAGALSGATGSFASPLANGLSSDGQLAVATVAGGVASVAGGGKFGNGAVTGAFGYLFNKALHDGDRGQKQPKGIQTAACLPCVVAIGAELGIGQLIVDGLTIGIGLVGVLTSQSMPQGTATIFQDGNHVSIQVDVGGASLHTEQITLHNNMTTIAVASVPGTAMLTLNLPNANAALSYSQSMIGQNTGLYNLGTNSCITYCGNVLRAGGLNVPNTTKDLIRHLRGLQ